MKKVKLDMIRDDNGDRVLSASENNVTTIHFNGISESWINRMTIDTLDIVEYLVNKILELKHIEKLSFTPVDLSKIYTGSITNIIGIWISVKDKMPKVGQKVLVLIDIEGNKHPTFGYLSAGFWQYKDVDSGEEYGCDYDRISHWMPIPKIPEVK